MHGQIYKVQKYSQYVMNTRKEDTKEKKNYSSLYEMIAIITIFQQLAMAEILVKIAA